MSDRTTWDNIPDELLARSLVMMKKYTNRSDEELRKFNRLHDIVQADDIDELIKFMAQYEPGAGSGTVGSQRRTSRRGH